MKSSKSLRTTVTVNPEIFSDLHEYLDSLPSRLRSMKLCELASAALSGGDVLVPAPGQSKREAGAAHNTTDNGKSPLAGLNAGMN